MNLTNDIVKAGFSTSEVIFTRFLYIRSDVYWSLYNAILTKNMNEAFFWAYEIYYSMLGAELMDFFEILMDKFICIPLDIAKRKIQYLINKWRLYNNQDAIVASVVWAFIQYSYLDSREKQNIVGALSNHFEHLKIKKNNKIGYLFVEYRMKDIVDYTTNRMTVYKKHYRILSTVCKYDSKKDGYMELDKLVGTDSRIAYYFALPKSREELTHIYHNSWLYWACKTPIWNQRLIEHAGIIDVFEQCINFDDEEKEEQFYKTYGYEPDEQPKKVFENCIGLQ